MEEYKSNSHKSREEQKALENRERRTAVVNSSAKIRKKSKFQEFADAFISEDVASVKSYIIMDVLIPAVKDAVSDIVKNGIDMMLFGETVKSGKNSITSKVSYERCYDRKDDRKEVLNRTRGNFNYDNIICNSRGAAEAVLCAMDDIINRYGVVSVGDLYDLAGISTTNYTVNKYGWTNIRSAHVVRTRDGYLLKLPRALPLN